MMRLRELRLERFGQFTDKVFDFRDGSRGSDFHIIYGPNEAGKTTTMEAYIRLLYGFRHQEPYDFLHGRSNLRVSGVFDLAEGPLHLSRLPKRAPNLLDATGNALPDHAVAAHLGGLSEEDYRALLCLDDDTIERGGEDIANARGDIGQLLFSAAAGIADMSDILSELRERADSLFRKRASTTRLAELKRELAEIDGQIREQDVSASQWRTLKDHLSAAVENERSAREERDRLRRELEQARALKRALPWLVEHDRLVGEVAPFADYPDQLDIDPESLVQLEKEQAQLEAKRDRLQKEIATAQTNLEALHPDQTKLELGALLDASDELRSRTQTAAIDLPKRRRELKDVMDEISGCLRELGLPPDTDHTALVPTMTALTALQQARDRLRTELAKHETAAQEHAEANKQHADAEAALRRLQDETPAPLGIEDLLRRHGADSLAPAAAQARQAVASARSAAADALAKLAWGKVSFGVLPECPVAIETARNWAETHVSLVKQLHEAEREHDRLKADIRAKTARINTISEASGVISDAEAKAARDERDRLWRLHLKDLRPESAHAFEEAMDEVDRLAEVRLAQASDLAELRQLERDLAELRVQAEAAGQRANDLEEQKATTEEDIARATGPIGLDDMDPSALVSWLERYHEAEDAQRKADAAQAEYAPVIRRAEALTKELADRLELENPTFEHALDVARRVADAEADRNRELEDAARRVRELAERLGERSAQLEKASKAASDAREQWNALVAEAFGAAVAPETLLEGIEHLRALREHDQMRERIQRQIRGMETDQENFAARIRDLASNHGLTEEDPLRAFHQLREIADEAKRQQERRKELTGEIKERQEALASAESRLEEIDRIWRLHAQAFPASAAPKTMAELRQEVGRAAEVIAKRERLKELGTQIVSELSASDIDAARSMLRNTTTAELEAQICSLETDLEQAEDALSAATETRVSARRNLDAVTGGAEVATLGQRRSTVLAEMEATALEYLEIDLGLLLAEEAIRRYRDIHRGPMIEATETAFRELTSGAYDALKTEFDGKQEILLAIHSTGATRRVSELSKGTRFQLYLALRAAAYEQMVGQGLALPFFCDDVFETFDDERTRAACKLMERIGRSGQAIYLTHHRHVIEIAKEVCQDQPLVHEL